MKTPTATCCCQENHHYWYMNRRCISINISHKLFTHICDGGSARLPCGWLMSLMKGELIRQMCHSGFSAPRSAGESSWQHGCWRSDNDITRCVTEDGLSLSRMGAMIRPVEPPRGSGDGLEPVKWNWFNFGKLFSSVQRLASWPDLY